MRTDVDPRYWLTWTTQPGDEERLHVLVVGRSNVTLDTGKLRDAQREDVLKATAVPVYLPEIKSTGAVQLRDYQKLAVEAIHASWAKGHKAPLVVCPTASGKTIIAASAMHLLWEGREKRSLFLAHRRELLDQTAEKIHLVSPNVSIGIVQSSRNELGQNITVASIQTLAHRSKSRLNELIANGPYGLVVCDEAHHAVSKQWTGVLRKLREANPEMLLFGMTATPGRADGTALDSVFDDIAFERNLFDMIAHGWLVQPKGILVTLDLDLDLVEKRNGDFVNAQLSQLMNTEHVNRAVVEAWQTFGHDRKTIVYAVDIDHGTALAQDFRDAGYAAESVSSKTKTKERDAIFARFRTGQTKLLVNVEIATEGYDEPSVEAILFARPTESQGLYAQILGRGLRLWPGKVDCLVIDCVGNSTKHYPVQLATLAGLDLEKSLGRKTDEEAPDVGDEESETPEVLGATMTGEEYAFGRRQTLTSRYKWTETELGWIMQIPRVGYYMVAWEGKGKKKAKIMFFDQREGRQRTAPREMGLGAIDFEMAYGLVESEMDRIFQAGARRRGKVKAVKDGDVPVLTFVDLDEGFLEEAFVPEHLVLKDAPWRDNTVTAKQGALLVKLGVKQKSMPKTMGEASDMISILRVQKDAKMRAPATPKQLAYLHYHGLEVHDDMTKSEAANIIWPHRKGKS